MRKMMESSPSLEETIISYGILGMNDVFSNTFGTWRKGGGG